MIVLVVMQTDARAALLREWVAWKETVGRVAGAGHAQNLA